MRCPPIGEFALTMVPRQQFSGNFRAQYRRGRVVSTKALAIDQRMLWKLCDLSLQRKLKPVSGDI